jgi:hypothetical protein
MLPASLFGTDGLVPAQRGDHAGTGDLLMPISRLRRDSTASPREGTNPLAEARLHVMVGGGTGRIGEVQTSNSVRLGMSPQCRRLRVMTRPLDPATGN